MTKNRISPCSSRSLPTTGFRIGSGLNNGDIVYADACADQREIGSNALIDHHQALAFRQQDAAANANAKANVAASKIVDR